eukprot:83959_1
MKKRRFNELGECQRAISSMNLCHKIHNDFDKRFTHNDISNIQDATNMAIVKKHIKYAVQLEKLMNIRTHLIAEIHDKKSIKKRNNKQGTFHPIGKLTKKIYEHILFTGKKAVGDRDCFPCHYQSQMEDIMFKELKSPDDIQQDLLNNIYYNPQKFTNQYPLFDLDRYSLSNDTKILTKNDLKIFQRYSKLYLAYLKKFTNFCGTKRSQKELQRVKRQFSHVYTFD